MKVVVLVISTVVILASNTASAQDVHDTSTPRQSSQDVHDTSTPQQSSQDVRDTSTPQQSSQDVHHTSTPQQSSANIEMQEQQSESEDELVVSSVAEATDSNVDEQLSLEPGEMDSDYDVEIYPADLEEEVIGDDPASWVYDPDDLEPEDKDSDSPPESHQPVTEFPPPFDHSTVDSSNVAQVAHCELLVDTDYKTSACVYAWFAFCALMLLVGWQEKHAKTVMRCWHGYMSGSRCK